MSRRPRLRIDQDILVIYVAAVVLAVIPSAILVIGSGR